MAIAKRTILILAFACAHCSSTGEPTDAGTPDAEGADARVSEDAAATDAEAIDLGVELPDSGVSDAGPDAGSIDPRPIVPRFTARGGTPPLMPAGRWGSTLVHIPGERRFVLFGGSQYPAGDTVGDFWTHSLDDGTWTPIATIDPPAPRYCHTMVYLPDHYQLLLVGGRNSRGPLAPGAWTLDLYDNTWRAISGDIPDTVVGPVSAWMPNFPAGPRAIVTGGSSRRGLVRETWAYDPELRMFTEVVTSSVPQGRQDGMIAYDPGPPGRLLLWGGSTQLFPTPVHRDDLWSFDGVDWKFIPTPERPRGRRSIGSAFDEVHREWVMFSGTIEDDDLLDLWVLDAATDSWREYPMIGAPDPRGFHAFAYAPEAELFVVFGGLRQPNFRAFDDGWELRLRE